ncbi:MAG: NAD-dependent dihydropyrimidine dehydrogenase PreA subunit [Verrucomicrobiales bacterium]|jgi:NAD-dependent dihydropyrimidine dehydrogenase PreA subunit
MISNEASPLQVVLYEGEGSSPLGEDARFSVFSGLLDRGYTVTRVSQAKIQKPESETRDRLLVLGNFGGNAPDLEDAAGKIAVDARDISGLESEAVFSLVDDFRDGGEASAMNRPPAAVSEAGKKSWKPWFPVIDYDRCTNCMQCLSFCLFDVYGVDDDKQIQVQNQDNCKTNCPACSRVCPEVAIMFPKYSAGPINGDEVSDKDVHREKMKVDISALLGGDIYANLRDRSVAAKTRFSKERSPDKALGERKKCLTKLQTDGLIPADVLAEIDLASLPSPDEIMRKAEDAAAKAKEALAAQDQPA